MQGRGVPQIRPKEVQVSIFFILCKDLQSIPPSIEFPGNEPKIALRQNTKRNLEIQ